MSLAQAGRPAPDFRAQIARPEDGPATPASTISLNDYRGKWLVFFWYPMDFKPGKKTIKASE